MVRVACGARCATVVVARRGHGVPFGYRVKDSSSADSRARAEPGSGLTIGTAGCIDGPLCVVPELWVEIWDAYQAGDLGRACEAQRRATEVAAGILQFGFLGALKAAIGERLQIDCGAPRPPQLPLDLEHRAALVERMRELGISPACR